MARDRLARWITGEALVLIRKAQGTVQGAGEQVAELSRTYGDVPDEDFRALTRQALVSLVMLDEYLAGLVREARRRGLG